MQLASNNLMWGNLDLNLSGEDEVTEDYYEFDKKVKNPTNYDELENFFIKLITGYRDEKDFYFIINDGEYNITQNSEYVILRKTNKPLKNLTLSSEYKYDWDTKNRIKDFFYELKILA